MFAGAGTHTRAAHAGLRKLAGIFLIQGLQARRLLLIQSVFLHHPLRLAADHFRFVFALSFAFTALLLAGFLLAALFFTAFLLAAFLFARLFLAGFVLLSRGYDSRHKRYGNHH